MSVSAVKAGQKKLGWKKTGPKYSQVKRELNCIARLAFCERFIEVGETFSEVIFTDEFSIWIEHHERLLKMSETVQVSHISCKWTAPSL